MRIHMHPLIWLGVCEKLRWLHVARMHCAARLCPMRAPCMILILLPGRPLLPTQWRIEDFSKIQLTREPVWSDSFESGICTW